MRLCIAGGRMTFLAFSRCAFGYFAVASILAGCGGAPSPVASAGAFRQNGGLPATTGSLPGRGAPFAHTSVERSWISPEAAKTGSLLYVSDINANAVHVY